MKRNWLKILVPVLVIGVLVFGIFGSGAWLSDQETSQGNTVAAGTLNLTIDGQEGANVQHLNVSNIYPSNPWSHSWGRQWIVTNTGTLPVKFYVTVSNIQNLENGCGTPEIVAGDTTCGTGGDQGELGQLMYAKIGPNNYGTNPYGVWNNGAWGSPVFNPLNSMNGTTTDGIVLQPHDSVAVYFDLEWDTHAGLQDNLGQSDSVQFDVTFTGSQVH